MCEVPPQACPPFKEFRMFKDANEAIEYGLADRVLQKAPEIVRDKEQEQE